MALVVWGAMVVLRSSCGLRRSDDGRGWGTGSWDELQFLVSNSHSFVAGACFPSLLWSELVWEAHAVHVLLSGLCVRQYCPGVLFYPSAEDQRT